MEQKGFENFLALSLEASFAVVRSCARAAPVGSVLVAGAAEVEDALMKNLSVAAADQHRVELAQRETCNEKKKKPKIVKIK